MKIKYREQWNEGRSVAAKYTELLGDIENIMLPKEMVYGKSV